MSILQSLGPLPTGLGGATVSEFNFDTSTFVRIDWEGIRKHIEADVARVGRGGTPCRTTSGQRAKNTYVINKHS